MRQRRPYKKVVVIGLDGLEPKLVAPLIAAGVLPNLARLEAAGGFATVATTSPAQTPVAWSTFATGTNPGGHGVFDFIRRDPRTYQPDLALNRYEQKSPWLPPKAVNLRRGAAVWDVLADRGLGSTVLRCPCSYPPALARGRMLSGMGVPDLRGGLGTPSFFTTAEVSAGESENVIRLPSPSGDSITTQLPGPRHPRDRSTLTTELMLRIDRAARSVTVVSSGSPSELTVPLGTWSDWLRVKFKAGLLQAFRGMVRFHLVRLEPHLELYASPINFDPEQPPFPISSPAGYAQELTQTLGTFHTTGMVEDHTGLNNERFGEDAFLDQCDDAWDEREAMLLHELDRFDEGLFYCLFDTPDRVQHMLWRFREPDHPANRGAALAPGMAQEIERQYRRADEVVGHALEAADGDTLVVVLSDHGFGSFRRGFHLNTWLQDQGLLALRESAAPGPAHDAFPNNIDWSRTRAYALGLGGIYLNLEGREGRGTVKECEADDLKRSIARHLAGLVDKDHGTVGVREVKLREELYQGPYAEESPDLVVHLASGYRVSWDSSLGGVGEGLFEDNRKKWGGDHIIDPALVPGVLFMNQPFRGEGARLVDLAPSILDALGQSPAPAMEGSSLLR
jgi:predicted AlkP superfamily phosphohydrolase/phosphomutase